MYTAQLGVALNVSRSSLELTAPGRSFRIDRENLRGMADTSVLGIFKRGIHFIHQQPGLPNTIVFYPAADRDHVRRALADLGWG